MADAPSPLYWYPTYPSVWLASPVVSTMLIEQEGAYRRLLDLAWGDGSKEPSLPTDATQLAQMSKLGARWRKLGHLIIEQFEERNGRLVNAAQAALWWEQQAKHAEVVKKASAGGKAKAAKHAAARAASGAPGVPQAELELRPGSANIESEAVPPVPNGTGVEQPTPDSAPAPEGARFAGAVSGEGRLVGVSPLRTLDAPSIAEQQQGVADHERRYFAALSDAADAWIAANADEAAVLDGEERMLLEIPLSVALPSWQARMLRDAVLERIRARNGWADAEAWDGEPFPITFSVGAAP